MYDYQSEIQALWPITVEMQIRGMHIDIEALRQTKRDVVKAVQYRESLLKDLIGWIPNTKSPIDMGKLFDQFKIPYQLTPKSGKPKISKETLLAIGFSISPDRPNAIALHRDHKPSYPRFKFFGYGVRPK